MHPSLSHFPWESPELLTYPACRRPSGAWPLTGRTCSRGHQWWCVLPHSYNSCADKSWIGALPDGGGPSSPHHRSQDPKLDRLEPCDELLDSRRERLAHDEERLQEERLGGSLDRLRPITRSMTKHLHAQMGPTTYWREKNVYMLHGGPIGEA